MISSLERIFEDFYEIVGIDAQTAKIILFILALLTVFLSIVKFLISAIKLVRNKVRTFLNNKDIFPFFTRIDVVNATKNYVPTRYQNISPTEDNEPRSKYIASAKDRLVPLFIDKVFKVESDENKYFLILADSGMGKTTFLVNLYLKYKNLNYRSLRLKKLEIKLIPIWHQQAFDYIEKVVDKENTILLLDAFDEMIEAQENYFKALKRVLDKTASFRLIVLTCRTQFFPTKNEEPRETGYFTAGENGEYNFQKVYLSVFDDNDVRKYLKKKYPYFWQLKKRKAAIKICEKSSNLIIRPMLLNYIEDIVKEEKSYKYSFQIYHALISSWMKRESNKRAVKEKYQTDFRFFKALKQFSKKIALDMYLHRVDRNGYHIPKFEGIRHDLLTLEDISDGDVTLTDLDAKSKSLLNRTADGEYKFSHKSVLEYYLAESIFNKELPFEDFDFRGMDMVKLFLSEMLIDKLSVSNGSFVYRQGVKGSRKELKLNFLQIGIVNQVEELVIDDDFSIQPTLFLLFINLKQLKLAGNTDLKIIYEIYWAIYRFFGEIYELVENQNIPKNMKEKYEEFIKSLRNFSCTAIAEHLEHMTYEKIKGIVAYLQTDLNSMKSYKLEGLLNEFTSQEIDKIQNAELYFQKIHVVSKKLPNCTILY